MSEVVVIATFVVLFLAGVFVLALGAFMWAKAITGAHNATMNGKQASDFIAPPTQHDEQDLEQPVRREPLRTRTRMADLTDEDLASLYHNDDDDESDLNADRRAARDEREGKVRTMDENSGFDPDMPHPVARG